VTRLCLHAAKLSFHHPSSGEWMEIDSVMPDDFRAAVESFMKKREPR
jgi:23S rRNA pseudouridine1911/1915/1917 synthase